MADNIFKILNKKTFAIMGNVHSHTKKLSLNGISITPAGFYLFEKLKNKMISINLPKTKPIPK